VVVLSRILLTSHISHHVHRKRPPHANPPRNKPQVANHVRFNTHRNHPKFKLHLIGLIFTSTPSARFITRVSLLLKSSSVTLHQCLSLSVTLSHCLSLWFAVCCSGLIWVFLCICALMGIDPGRETSIALVVLWNQLK
jgi:hypothetical protein